MRRGLGGTASRKLIELPAKKIPREWVWRFADLARRTNNSHWGLRLLKPIIFSEIKVIEPTPQEMNIYAGLLVKIGAVSEAQKRLNGLQTITSRVLLYKAFACVSQWDYASAKEFLELLLEKHPFEDGYENAVAMVNLVAAYINLAQWQKAQTLLKEVRSLAEKNAWSLLLSNINELSALFEIERATMNSEFEKAYLYLQKAEALIEGGKSMNYHLFLSKWKMVLSLKQQGGTRDSKSLLYELRKRSIHLKHWETLRECDFYEALYFKDESLAKRLFFGTPFSSYRNKILRHFPRVAISSSYLWSPGGLEIEPRSSCSLLVKIEEALSSHHKVLNLLLHSLVWDFYRPQPIGSIFEKVYPSEFYNPISTPGRILKNIQRLRAELRKLSGGWKVEGSVEGFYLTAEQGSFLEIKKNRLFKLESLVTKLNTDRLQILKIKYPYQSFSSHQAGKVLSLSQRSVNNLLSWAIGKKKIKTQGNSKNRRYFF